MATYKGISGFNIKSLATDPSNLKLGEIWYNSTSGTLKVAATVAGAFSSGTNITTARRSNNGAGDKNAALVVNGYGPAMSNATEEYDGSAWTTTGNATFSVYGSAGGGTQTTAWMTGGDLGPANNLATNEYDGSAWASTNTNPNAQTQGGGCGVQTAGLYAGGGGATGTQTYNGSTWTATPHVLNVARTNVAQAMTGIQDAAIVVGNEPATTVVESYDGSSWSVIPATIPNAGYAISSAGTQTATLIYWGGPAGFDGTTTATYNGTSWTTGGALGTPRGSGGSGKGASTEGTAFLASGQTPGPSNSSAFEEYTAAAAGAITITTS